MIFLSLLPDGDRICAFCITEVWLYGRWFSRADPALVESDKLNLWCLLDFLVIFKLQHREIVVKSKHVGVGSALDLA